MSKQTVDLSVYTFPAAISEQNKEKNNTLQALVPFSVRKEPESTGHASVTWKKIERMEQLPDPGSAVADEEAPDESASDKEQHDEGLDQQLPPEQEVAVSSPEHAVDTPVHPPVITQEELDEKLAEAFQKGLQQGQHEQSLELAERVRSEAESSGLLEGHRQGYQDGFDQGLNSASKEIEKRYSVLTEMKEQVEQLKLLLSGDQIRQVAELLEHLVQEVVRVELKHSPEQIRQVVTEAVQLLDRRDQETLLVRIHPDDMGWLSSLPDAEDLAIKLVADEQITLGGCRVEGALGEVDSTLESRLKAGINKIRAVLLSDPEPAEDVDFSTVQNNRRLMAAPVFESTEARTISRPQPARPKVNFEVGSAEFDPQADNGGELGGWSALGQ